MLLWLLACGEEPKGEPEVETPAAVDVSAHDNLGRPQGVYPG